MMALWIVPELSEDEYGLDMSSMKEITLFHENSGWGP